MMGSWEMAYYDLNWGCWDKNTEAKEKWDKSKKKKKE